MVEQELKQYEKTNAYQLQTSDKSVFAPGSWYAYSFFKFLLILFVFFRCFNSYQHRHQLEQYHLPKRISILITVHSDVSEEVVTLTLILMAIDGWYSVG